MGLAQPLIVKGAAGTLWPLAFSPDGSLVAAGALDGTARLWDTKTGKPVVVLSGHGAMVSSIAFTPDGKQVITTKGTPFTPHDLIEHNRANAAALPRQGEIRFWDARTGELLRTIEIGAYTAVSALAVSPDGTLLAVATSSHPGLIMEAPQPPQLRDTDGINIVIFDLPKGRFVRTIKELRNVHRLLFSTDGRTLIGAAFSSLAFMGAESKDKEDIRLWDVETGKPQMVLQNIANATGLALSPDGKTIATCRGDFQKWQGEWTLWDSATGQPKGTVSLDYPLLSIAFSPDGKTVTTGGGPLPGTVKQWSVTTGEALPWQALATAR